MKRTHFPLACLIIAIAPAALAAQDSSQSPDEVGNIASRIRQLGDNDFAVRQAASLALTHAGPESIAPLADAVRKQDPEVRNRALHLLVSMARGGSDSHRLPAHRAIEALADDESPAIARRANAMLVQLQLALAADFERLGSSVKFDERRRINYLSLNVESAGDDALDRLALLGHLETLNASRTRITSAGLHRMANLPRLTKLEMRYTAIDNAGLAPLVHLPRLAELNLQGTQIDDRGALQLADMTALRVLSVEKTAVTDVGLESLCSLARLETLYLGESQIAGDRLAHLARLPKLKYLSLRKLPLGDEQISPLGVCTQLELLGLDESPITSACLVSLAHLPHLRVLWLTNTQVDDASIETLGRMKSLERLHLRGTKMTREGVESLQTLLPQTQISY